MERPLTVAWISFFPVEWLPGVPTEVSESPRQHPATWQRVLLNELKSVPSLKLHVIVLRKQFARSLKFEWDGVTFHLIKTPPGVRATSMFWVDTHLIKRTLKGIKPDLVHAWGTENGAALVASRLGCPYLVTIQGLMSWLAETVPVSRYFRLAARLEHLSLRRAHAVTAESRFAVEYIRARHPHLEVRHVEHVPARLFHEVDRQPPVDRIRLLFVGLFSHAKGGDVLLKAVHLLSKELSLDLVLVGEADDALLRTLPPNLMNDIRPCLAFKRELPSDEVARELAQATFVVCPTRVDTGPVAAKEAVVAGVPVVGSAVGGLLDYIRPEKNGLLFEPGNLDSLVGALRAACNHPLFRHGHVDATTLTEMRDYLSPVRMAKGMREAYQEVCRQ